VLTVRNAFNGYTGRACQYRELGLPMTSRPSSTGLREGPGRPAFYMAHVLTRMLSIFSSKH